MLRETYLQKIFESLMHKLSKSYLSLYLAYISGIPQAGKPIVPKKGNQDDGSKAPSAARSASAEPAKDSKCARARAPAATPKPSQLSFTPTKSPPAKRSKSQTDPSEFSGKSDKSGASNDTQSTRASSCCECFYTRGRRFSQDFGALLAFIRHQASGPRHTQGSNYIP